MSVVDINAPGDRVWQVLTDLNGYRAWNPFLTSASGAIAPGNTLTIAAKIGKRTITFHPRISAVEPGKNLVWVDQLLSSEFFQDEHEFEVIEIDQSHTRVIQSAHFRGILVAPFWSRFSPALLARVSRYERRSQTPLRTNGCDRALRCPRHANFKSRVTGNLPAWRMIALAPGRGLAVC